ncbi:adenylate cyclase protein, partial [Aureobasidium melanogenum]
MSSTGSSKRSITGKFHKKLQGFFGDEFDPNAPPPKEVPEQSDKRGRNPSNATQVTATTRPGSPSASRPRTPNTSSEVTPWDFEPAPANFHTQPTQQSVAPSIQQQQQQTRKDKGSVSGRHHRLHLPGHRHKTSLDDIDDSASVASSRAGTIRKDSTLPTNLNGARPRATSPSPSMRSMMSAQQSQASDAQGQRSPGAYSAKRSLFDRVTGRKKHDKTAESTLKNLPASTGSLSQTPTALVGKKKGPLGPDGKPMALGLTKKEHTRIPFKGPRRAEPSAEFNKKDPNAPRPEAIRNASA